MRLFKNTLIVLAIILYALPVILGFIYVYLYGVNVVMGDQWSFFRFFDSIPKGTFDFYDFVGHNEHLVAFPEVVMLVLGYLTKYNNIAEMYFIECFLLVVLVTIFTQFKSQFKFKKFYLWFIPIPFLIFSLRQSENMLFGFQITFMFAMGFSVFAFHFINLLKDQYKTGRNFALAVLCAIIASNSAVMGLFTWPAGYIQILLLPIERKDKTVFKWVWSIVGLVKWLLYFVYLYSYKKGQPSTKVDFLGDLVNYVKYSVLCLGGALSPQLKPALLIGVIIISLIILCIYLLFKSNRLETNNFWIAIGCFVLLAVISIALGRLQFGMDFSLSSRYTTFSLLIVVALYILLLDLVLNERRPMIYFLMGCLLIMITISIPNCYLDGFKIGPVSRDIRQKAAFILYNYNSQPDDYLKQLYPSPEEVKNGASILKKLNYNVFYNQDSTTKVVKSLGPASKTLYSIDPITFVPSTQENSNTNGRKTDYFIVNGWAIDNKMKNLAGGVIIDIDGKLYDTFYGIDRNDVASYLKNGRLRYSGFERAIPISTLEPGRHALCLRILTNDRKAYYVSESKTIFKTR
ncbi:MAG: hypothetical protein ACYC25_07620 [Paludibacter sp.]